MVSLPTDRSRSGWWVLAVAFGLVVVYIGYRFVGTFVVGIFAYYATRPLFRRLNRIVKHRSIAAAMSLWIMALPAIFLTTYALAIAIRELEVLRRQYDLGGIGLIAQRYNEQLGFIARPEQLLEQPDTLDAIFGTLGQIQNSIAFVGMVLLHGFIILSLAYYLLKDDYRISRWVRGCFDDRRGVTQTYLHAVDTDLKSIFFGNILNALITGTIGSLSYMALNIFLAPPGHHIPHEALIGLLAGVASLVPIVGMKIVYLPVFAYLAGRMVIQDQTSLLWFPAVFFAISFVIVDTIPDLLLRPYVSGRNLHIGLVMFAYIFGPLLFGWYGLFFGPMIMVIVFHFFRLIFPELARGTTIRPYSVDPVYLEESPAE